jgi:uncharacterized membrane protein
MAASEKGSESEPAFTRVAPSLVIKLFALFALLFGLAYSVEGVFTLMIALSRRYSFSITLLNLAVIIFDLLIGTGSMVIGFGLFFQKEWARKGWLIFLIFTVLVHFHMTIMQVLAGYSNLGRLYAWIGMVVLISVISWAYLSKASIKARFR